MEKLRRVVNEIAYTETSRKLSPLHRSLIPFLSFASSLYKFALSLRRSLYHLGFFATHRLPVPVISVGNLTWGGNGKTPMVEFIALWLADSGNPPLILSRSKVVSICLSQNPISNAKLVYIHCQRQGYGGGDEVNMLKRHLRGTSTKFGVGANRVAVAVDFIQIYGYIDSRNNSWIEKPCFDGKLQSHFDSEKIGAVVLDDAMQHWRMWRDLEIVMVNGLTLWGNRQLMPLGPLREPLVALRRADVVVVHHADLVSERILNDIESIVRGIKDSVPIYFTRMNPSYLFEVGISNSVVPLRALQKAIVLCVSAIGSADSFVQGMQKMGTFYVDRFDFSDHHRFHARDIEMIRARVEELADKFGSKPIVVVTEKDYDRDPEILKQLFPFKVFVLCSKLRVMSYKGSTEGEFKKLLKEKLELKLPGAN